MRATIRDVARKAGVSISTVSRVLNNTCPVNEDKRVCVEDAALQLGYTPDPAARSLLKRETGGVGVLVPSVSEEFFSEFLTGIDRLTQENGYYLLISSSHRSREEFEKAVASMYRRVDGLLVMALDQGGYDPDHPALNDVPVVYVNTKVRKGTESIIIENEDGFRRITEHVLKKGHSKLAMIKGPEKTNDAIERLRGYRKALKQFGIPKENSREVEGFFTRESGYKAAQEILASGLNPTAILAANDLSALGALSALHEAGLRIPEQIVLTGFDDVSSTRYSTPQLTTVRVPIRMLGERAATRLFGLIGNGNGKEGTIERMPVELVLRASTGD